MEEGIRQRVWHLLGTECRLVFLPFPNQMIQTNGSLSSPPGSWRCQTGGGDLGRTSLAKGLVAILISPPGAFKANLINRFL